MNPIILSVLDFLLMMWQNWTRLIVAPFNTPNLLWVIIPIWVTWFFTERYQELNKTSLGNAITNGAVVLWVSIDWIRMLVRILTESSETFNVFYAMKFGLAAITFTYGGLIIFFGIRKKKFIHYFGRIREITYVMITFSPMIYGIIEITWQSMLSILFFFPLFYFLIELFNAILPKPKTYEEDEKDEDNSKNSLKSFDSKPNLLLDKKLGDNTEMSFSDSLKNKNINNNNTGFNDNSNNSLFQDGINNPLSDNSLLQPSNNMNNNLEQQSFSNEQNFSQNNNSQQQSFQENSNNPEQQPFSQNNLEPNNLEQNNFQQNNEPQNLQNNNSLENNNININNNINNNNIDNNNNFNNNNNNKISDNNKRKSRFSDLPEFEDENNNF